MNNQALEPLRKRLAAFAEERDWNQFHSPKNLSMALIAESAELVEHFQWRTEQQSRTLDADTLDAVALELADIFIYLIRLSDTLGVNLLDATDKKIAINQTRYPVDKVRGSARRASEYDSD